MRNVSSPAVSAMNAASDRGAARRSEGSHARPERDRDDAHENSDHGQAGRSVERRLLGLDGGGHVVGRHDAGGGDQTDRVRVVLDPEERHRDRCRLEPPERPRALHAVDRERDDRVVDRHLGEGQVAPAADSSRGSRSCPVANSTRRTSNSSAGGGALPTRPSSESPAATVAETTPIEEDRRDERPQPPAKSPSRRGRGYVGVHQSATSKKPIQPSSVNSDTWAWNMKCPVFLKSISTMPALALAQHDGVGVLERPPVPGRVVAEELAVQVERVDEVELGDVHEVDPHGARPADADRMARVVEGPSVHGVELVRTVTVRVVAVHHHDELLGRRARGRSGSMISAP